MTESVWSAGSNITRLIATFGRSAPVPLPWNGVQCAPASLVRNRCPTELGTADPSRWDVAALLNRYVAPSALPPSEVACRGNAVPLGRLSGLWALTVQVAVPLA